MLKTILMSAFSIAFLVILLFPATASAQHPCDAFVNTCNIPSFSAWTVNDTIVNSTGQTGEPVAHTFYTTVQNPLQTNWYHWTAPINGVVVANTAGTNPNALPPSYQTPFVIDSTIAVYTGTSLTTLTRIDESDDWVPQTSPNSSCSHSRPIPESIFSSCMMFPVTAGTVYHFQVDHLSETSALNNDFALNLYYRASTSAEATINGRVTNVKGAGIARVRLTLTKPTGEVVTAMSNTFGYYSFENLEAGQFYTIEANAKRFRFDNNPRVIELRDSVQSEDFVQTQ